MSKTVRQCTGLYTASLKGGYIVVEGGEGITPLIVYFDNIYGNLDSLRAFLRHCDGHFGADLVAIFTCSI